jgi:hypothetical protein
VRVEAVFSQNVVKCDNIILSSLFPRGNTFSLVGNFDSIKARNRSIAKGIALIIMVVRSVSLMLIVSTPLLFIYYWLISVGDFGREGREPKTRVFSCGAMIGREEGLRHCARVLSALSSV